MQLELNFDDSEDKKADRNFIPLEEVPNHPEAMAVLDQTMCKVWSDLYQGRERDWWKPNPEPIVNQIFALGSFLKSLSQLGIDWRAPLSPEELKEAEVFIKEHS